MIARALNYLKLDVLMKPIMLMKAWCLRKFARNISCYEFNDIVFDYIDGDLTKNQTTAFQRHVSACPICPNYLKAYITTYEAKSHISLYDDIIVPDAVPQELIDAIVKVNQNLEK